MESLKADIVQLLNLTKETLDHEYPKAEEPNSLDSEFQQFMQEMKELDALESDPTQIDLKDELQSLIGTKCQAPHIHLWGSKAYHNAFVCGLDESQDDISKIMVKVLFTNPTHQEMIPCPYYLDGDCKFDDEKCRYSHGESVHLDELKDFHEPDFSLLHRKNCSVLAKGKNKIWSKGIIRNADYEKKICKVRLDENKLEVDLNFEDILPVDTHEHLESESENEDYEEDVQRAQIIEKSLFNPVSDQKMGKWEEHTRGIGSKIMMKMGYVIGSGLGSKGDGILVPVCAQILPQGRSLDYCMNLREQANGDKNLFSVEKKLDKLRKRQEQINKKEYEKGKNEVDMFHFLNTRILANAGEQSTESKIKTVKSDLKAHSSQKLNVASLQVSETIKKKEKELEKLRFSLGRQKAGSQIYSNLKMQIQSIVSEIKGLQDAECTISKEKQMRDDHKKMAVF